MPKKPDSRFRTGHDPRRHQLIAPERRRGYRNALKATEYDARLYACLYRRIRGFYRADRRSA